MKFWSLLFLVLSWLWFNDLKQDGFFTSHNTITRSIAMQLAMDKLEEIAAKDPATLSSANNQTENITHDSLKYTRTVAITINADRSRQVQVIVHHTCPMHPINVVVADSFVLRGER